MNFSVFAVFKYTSYFVALTWMFLATWMLLHSFAVVCMIFVNLVMKRSSLKSVIVLHLDWRFDFEYFISLCLSVWKQSTLGGFSLV